MTIAKPSFLGVRSPIEFGNEVKRSFEVEQSDRLSGEREIITTCIPDEDVGTEDKILGVPFTAWDSYGLVPSADRTYTFQSG
jgi:hypothetical protein